MGLDAHTIIMLCTDHTENWRRHGRTPGGIAGFVYERDEKTVRGIYHYGRAVRAKVIMDNVYRMW